MFVARRLGFRCWLPALAGRAVLRRLNQAAVFGSNVNHIGRARILRLWLWCRLAVAATLRALVIAILRTVAFFVIATLGILLVVVSLAVLLLLLLLRLAFSLFALRLGKHSQVVFGVLLKVFCRHPVISQLGVARSWLYLSIICCGVPAHFPFRPGTVENPVDDIADGTVTVRLRPRS